MLKFEESNTDVIFTSKTEGSFQSTMIDRLRRELQDVNLQILDAQMKYQKWQSIYQRGEIEKLTLFIDTPLLRR